MDQHNDQITGSQAAPQRPRSQDSVKTASLSRDVMAIVSERIQVIIDAAETAAAGILEDAEAQARRFLEESRRRADAMAAERVQAISELLQAVETPPAEPAAVAADSALQPSGEPAAGEGA